MELLLAVTIATSIIFSLGFVAGAMWAGRPRDDAFDDVIAGIDAKHRSAVRA